MAITATTLTGAVGVNDLTIGVAATTGNAVKNVIQIDNEWLTQTADVGGLNIPVRRGEQGSYNQIHTAGAVVLMGLASDFPAAPPGTVVPIPVAPSWTTASYVASGAIAIPTTKQNVYVKLSGPTTNAYTLADPTYAQEGIELLIQAEAAHAYTVNNSAGSGFNGGGAGGDVGTYGGAVGDNLHVRAVSGVWVIINKVNVTLG